VVNVLEYGIIEYVKKRLNRLFLHNSIVFLDRLGSFQYDTISVIVEKKGCLTIQAVQICNYFSLLMPLDVIRPVYFEGGPMQSKKFKGTFLSFVADRTLLILCEKGKKYIDRLFDYEPKFF
jgi:hypothetical protein